MKCVIVLSLLVAVVVAGYDTKYDNPELENVLKDRTVLKKFVDCFNDAADCDEVAGEYKKDIGHAILNDCKECNPVQKNMVSVFAKLLKQELPEDFKLFQAKHDADGTHLGLFLA